MEPHQRESDTTTDTTAGNAATATLPEPPQGGNPGEAAAEWIAEARRRHARGDLAGALDLCRRAVAARPSDPEPLALLGALLLLHGEASEAVVPLQAAAEALPARATVHTHLGVALAACGDPDGAEHAHARALALDPLHADAHANLANLLRRTGRPGKALVHCRRALELDPDHGAATNNLAAALHDLGRPTEAVELLLDLVRRRPDHGSAHYNLGLLFLEHNEVAAAIRHLRLALTAAPADPHVRWNLANALLLIGEYHLAWPLYEARQETGATTPAPYRQPMWDGTPFPDQTLLIHAEQGLGDTVQLVRLLDRARGLGGRVVLLCPAALAPLLEGVAGADAVVAGDAGTDPGLPFDLHLPLPSLPGRLDLTLETLPGPVPYLTAPADRVAEWAARLPPRADGEVRVGVVWSGNPDHRNDARRSLPAAALAPLAAVEGARLFSLQKGAAAGELEGARLDATPLGDDLHDFAETAAVIANLDLVVTVDTAVAHVAGALGQPVWLLLPFVPDWRWQLTRTNSPWYPTARLFRQPRPGDWEAVVAEVAATLG